VAGHPGLFLLAACIIVPAGTYTLALVAPAQTNNNLLVSLIGSGWAIVAAIPLIWGIVPTARFTFVFLITESLIIGLFFVLGFVKLLTHGAGVAPSPHWFVPGAGTNYTRLHRALRPASALAAARRHAGRTRAPLSITHPDDADMFADAS